LILKSKLERKRKSGEVVWCNVCNCDVSECCYVRCYYCGIAHQWTSTKIWIEIPRTKEEYTAYIKTCKECDNKVRNPFIQYREKLVGVRRNKPSI
jgi:hypothetical protein